MKKRGEDGRVDKERGERTTEVERGVKRTIKSVRGTVRRGE